MMHRSCWTPVWLLAVFLVAPPASPAPVRFGTIDTFFSGSRPQEILHGDFNEDGMIDVLVLNSSSGESSVLLTGATPTPEWCPIYVPAIPNDATVGDFNGDQHLDVAYTLVWPGLTGVWVVLGDGTGLFNDPISFDLGFDPYRIRSSDFDGDTRLDLAVAAQNETISILLGDGAGGFLVGSAVTLTGHVIEDLEALDLDENGDDDLLVLSSVGGVRGVSFFAGSGDGGFALPIETSVPSGSGGMKIASIDPGLDDDLDLILRGGDVLVFLYGAGDGTFEVVESTLLSESNVQAVGDFSGDGWPDVAATQYGTQMLRIYRGDGKRGFPSFDRILVPGGASVTDLDCSDIDQDGVDDLVASLNSRDEIAVILGGASSLIEPPRVFDSRPSAGRFAEGDFSGDGREDFVLVLNSGAEVIFRASFGNGFFAPVQTSNPVSVGVRSLAKGDFDGDGSLDLAVSSSGGVKLLVGDGAGLFPSAIDNGGVSNPRAIVAGDVNGDGIQDLFVEIDNQEVAVLRGSLTGFTLLSTISVTTIRFDPVPILAADLNGDTFADLVVRRRVAMSSERYLSVLVGDGNGGFTVSDQIRLDTGSARLAQFDGDGHLDLLVLAPDGQVYFLGGSGAGSFNDGTVVGAFSTGSLGNFQVRELNGDGKIDFVATQGNDVLLLSSNSIDASYEQTRLDVGRSNETIRSIVLSDFDRDGADDLFTHTEVSPIGASILHLNRSTLYEAREGAIQGGIANPAPVVFVNGSPGFGRNRRIGMRTSDSFELRVEPAPGAISGFSRFALYGWRDCATSSDATVLTLGLGASGLPMPLQSPGFSETPVVIWNNMSGFDHLLGAATQPSSRAPTKLLNLPSGIPFTGKLYLQGIMIDQEAPNGQGGVTNGVQVIVRP